MRRVENRKRRQAWGVIYRLSRTVNGLAYGMDVAFTHVEMEYRDAVAAKLRTARRQLADFSREHYPAADFCGVDA